MMRAADSLPVNSGDLRSPRARIINLAWDSTSSRCAAGDSTINKNRRNRVAADGDVRAVSEGSPETSQWAGCRCSTYAGRQSISMRPRHASTRCCASAAFYATPTRPDSSVTASQQVEAGHIELRLLNLIAHPSRRNVALADLTARSRTRHGARAPSESTTTLYALSTAGGGFTVPARRLCRQRDVHGGRFDPVDDADLDKRCRERIADSRSHVDSVCSPVRNARPARARMTY